MWQKGRGFDGGGLYSPIFVEINMGSHFASVIAMLSKPWGRKATSKHDTSATHHNSQMGWGFDGGVLYCTICVWEVTTIKRLARFVCFGVCGGWTFEIHQLSHTLFYRVTNVEFISPKFGPDFFRAFVHFLPVCQPAKNCRSNGDHENLLAS